MKKNKTKKIIHNLFNSFSAEPITPKQKVTVFKKFLFSLVKFLKELGRMFLHGAALCLGLFH